jgi:hypothetical protein
VILLQHVSGGNDHLFACRVIERHVGNISAHQIICTCDQSLFVPMITAAFLPSNTAEVAELGTARTAVKQSAGNPLLRTTYSRHMITARVELHDAVAIVASLPSFLNS